MSNKTYIDTTLLSIMLTSIFFVTLMQCMEDDHLPLTSPATIHNNTLCTFTTLPHDMLFTIFSYCLVKEPWGPLESLIECDSLSLKKSIETFFSLRDTCTTIKKLLPWGKISTLCKKYSQESKDDRLVIVLDSISNGILKPDNYATERPFLFVLLYAGANVNTRGFSSGYVLSHAIFHHDESLIKLLFSGKANPNIDITFYYNPTARIPIFFTAQTIQIAQLCIDAGADLKPLKNGTTVLWNMIHKNYASELMQWYLDQGVDAKTIRTQNNACLLHALAESDFFSNIHLNNTNDIDNFLKKTKLLCKQLPEMINTLNANGQTPLDALEYAIQNTYTDLLNHEELERLLEQMFCCSEEMSYDPAQEIVRRERRKMLLHAFEQLVAIFKEYDTLTAQEPMSNGYVSEMQYFS